MSKYLLFSFTFFICVSVSHGQQWTAYNVKNNGSASDNIASLSIDENGKLYAGGVSGLMTLQNNKWVNMPVGSQATNLSIFRVYNNPGNLWVGTEFNGLYGYANSQWKNYDPNTAGQGIVGIAVTSKGVIYRIDKFQSFSKWSGTEWVTISNPYQATNMFADSKDNIWVLNEGLNKYDGSTLQNWSASHGEGSPDYISVSGCNAMTEDSKGVLWVATNDGLLKYDGNTFSVLNTSNSGLPTNRLSCLKFDKQGNLWIGSADAGVIMYNGTNWLQYTVSNSALTSPRINDIVVDNNDQIWIADGFNALTLPYGGQGIFMLNKTAGNNSNQLPAAPANLTSQVISVNEVNLSWKDNSDNESSFSLERSTGDSLHYQAVKLVTENTTSFTDLTVIGNTTYYYRIRAANSYGNSSYSNSIAVLPKYCTVNKADYGAYAIATKVSFGDIYNTPHNCTNGYYNYLDQSTKLFKGQTLMLNIAFGRCQITSDSNIGGSVYIDWNSDGDFDDAGEMIFNNVNINGQAEYLIPITVPNNVVPGTVTRLRIRSEDDVEGRSSVGPCGYAEETQDYTLFIVNPMDAQPSKITAAATSYKKNTVTWEDDASNESQYIIERSADGLSFGQIATAKPNIISYRDTLTTPDTKYFYRVSAVVNGVKKVSAVASVTSLSAGLVRQTTGDLANLKAFAYGAYWVDVDNDSRYDLLEPSGSTLYLNKSTGFVRSTQTLPASNVLAFADIDNDGDQDAFCPASGSNSTANIFINDGNGVFTGKNILSLDAGATITNAVWTDYNNDGYLDLYISYANYGKLYRNEHGNKFTFVQKFDNVSGYASFADYDNDGDDDLIVMGNSNTFVYTKTDSTFTVNNNSSLTSVRSDYTRGLSWGDVDNDGRIDLFMPASSDNVTSNIYLNKGSFVKNELTMIDGDAFGSALADYDNDGYLDLYVARSNKVSKLLRNKSGVFTEQPISLFEHEDYSSFPYEARPAGATAWADYNNDGFPDLFVAINNGFGSLLYQNTGNQYNWINIKLKGTKSNADGIGAKVKLKSNNQWQFRWVQSGSGYAAQNSLAVAFGIKNATKIDSIVVNWPSGIVDVIANADINKQITLIEGQYPAPIPVNNFKVAVTSVTCRDEKNGSINISTTRSASYTAVLTGSGLSKTYSFNTSVIADSLAAGAYNLCISDAANPNAPQCFDLNISEPKDLAVYSAVNKTANTINLDLYGGSVYNIELNGVSYTTTSSSITLPLKNSSNKLMVTTDKPCQGLIERIINTSDNRTPYPNPFRDMLYINLGQDVVANGVVTIFGVTDGLLKCSLQISNTSGVFPIDVSKLNWGVYSLHLVINSKETIYKIIKQ